MTPGLRHGDLPAGDCCVCPSDEGPKSRDVSPSPQIQVTGKQPHLLVITSLHGTHNLLPPWSSVAFTLSKWNTLLLRPGLTQKKPYLRKELFYVLWGTDGGSSSTVSWCFWGASLAAGWRMERGGVWGGSGSRDTTLEAVTVLSEKKDARLHPKAVAETVRNDQGQDI